MVGLPAFLFIVSTVVHVVEWAAAAVRLVVRQVDVASWALLGLLASTPDVLEADVVVLLGQRLSNHFVVHLIVEPLPLHGRILLVLLNATALLSAKERLSEATLAWLVKHACIGLLLHFCISILF